MKTSIITAFTLRLCVISALCGSAVADTYNISLDTSPLVGNPAAPFSVLIEFIDGNGFGDANNTVTITGAGFGGGSALGSPVVFGGASGSLETGVTIADTSFLNLFSEQVSPGLDLSFVLGLTANDDSDGIPDRLTFFLVDGNGVPVPTLAPFADYFLGVDLGSAGPVFDVYGSDPSRSLSVGGPVLISAPSIAVSPEPDAALLLGIALSVVLFLGWLGASKRWRSRHIRVR